MITAGYLLNFVAYFIYEFVGEKNSDRKDALIMYLFFFAIIPYALFVVMVLGFLAFVISKAVR